MHSNDFSCVCFRITNCRIHEIFAVLAFMSLLIYCIVFAVSFWFDECSDRQAKERITNHIQSKKNISDLEQGEYVVIPHSTKSKTWLQRPSGITWFILLFALMNVVFCIFTIYSFTIDIKKTSKKDFYKSLAIWKAWVWWEWVYCFTIATNIGTFEFKLINNF